MNQLIIEGGVTTPKGFLASGEHLGIRKNTQKRDTALIISQTRAAAAACYTQNLVKGAPLIVTKQNIADGYAQAIVCNSGNANTCNPNGIEIAQGMCELVSQSTAIDKQDVIVASTGVIGQPMSLAPFEAGIPMLSQGLSNTAEAGTKAACAIMTTDTVQKECACQFDLNGKVCTIGGIAKGSGMICPNMATMLSFITSDACITPQLLQKALSDVVVNTFNMLSIDGDTSTNDMVTILANGMAENTLIDDANSEAYHVFYQALYTVCERLCQKLAKDGEGATHLLICEVSGANTKENARLVAKSVIKSSLLKSAIFGADANWGRVLCAIGYSGAQVDIHGVDVAFKSEKGTIDVCKDGASIPFSEEIAKEILLQADITVVITFHEGNETAKAWGCDLTYDYVKINGDYRT